MPTIANQAKSERKPLLITSGEPAGIGLDIICQIFAKPSELAQLDTPLLVLANADALAARANMLNLPIDVNMVSSLDNLPRHKLNVYDIACAQPVVAGRLAVENAHHVICQLHLAASLALQKRVSGIVTAPVQKSIINDAIHNDLLDLTSFSSQYDSNGNGQYDNQCGSSKDGKYDNVKLGEVLEQGFTGHTEFFQGMAGCTDVVMMLANDALKVALVTTHLPLSKVAHAITKEKLTTVIDILLSDMRDKFANDNPSILVCGLNPHAGEGGHLGVEEINIINPVLKNYQNQGVNISLALPADTLFSPHNLKHADCFLAMYHDQGLTVLKALGFGKTVNLTLGLPFIRTSVDHGTALDIAGTGKASSSSLLEAVKLAYALGRSTRFPKTHFPNQT